MKRHCVIPRSIIYLAIFNIVISASCSAIFTLQATPTIVPTSTPEKLELINGELDACQLIKLTEVESVLGMKVVPERTFVNRAPGCIYNSMIDDGVLFLTTATTDETIKRADGPKKYNSTQFVSATELYEIHKTGSLNLSKVLKIEDIDDLGDQAYLEEGVYFTLHILKNNIYYVFHTRIKDGIGYKALMEFAQIALQRMP